MSDALVLDNWPRSNGSSDVTVGRPHGLCGRPHIPDERDFFMSAQEAFRNWLLFWAVVGLGLLTAIVAAIIVALVSRKKREPD